MYLELILFIIDVFIYFDVIYTYTSSHRVLYYTHT